MIATIKQSVVMQAVAIALLTSPPLVPAGMRARQISRSNASWYPLTEGNDVTLSVTVCYI